MAEYDIETCELSASKHFKNTWMRKWNWDYIDLRNAIKNAYKTERVGKKKYEAYIRGKSGSRKMIFVYYAEFNAIFVITGAEGK
ncbi:MAG: hypothetical protein V3T58_05960 [Candidatus Hydrothermarchaeales archaeon]